MNRILLFIIILAYVASLFLIAFLVEKNKNKSKLFEHPIIYVLAIGVYCTAWTYFGSIGVAAKNGVDFLPIYLGPVIAAPLWIVVLKKMIHISKQNNVSSIADFLSLRYGNSRTIGAITTLVCLLAIIPYISLQLKAISESFYLITDNTLLRSKNIISDAAFYIALILAVFAAIFGSRSSDASAVRKGVFVVVAFESLLKLVLFLVAGIYITFFLFKGPNDIIQQATNQFNVKALSSISSLDHGVNWLFMICLSFFAIFLLPRQFQMAIVENTNRKQLKTAIWGFPLYLFLFNIFVVFIAWAGKLELPQSINADYTSILLPLKHNNYFIATLVFIGGLSAVISMIVVSTIALSTMVSNNVLIPFGLLTRFKVRDSQKNVASIKRIRQISVLVLLLISYLLLYNFRIQLSLFSLGLVSFLLIAQLAPSFFFGLFWSRGSALGAKWGILSGLLVTCYTYILPFTLATFFNYQGFEQNGPFQMQLLKPFQLFGLQFLDPIPHAFFWSITINIATYLIASLAVVSHYRERNYAEMVVNNSELNYQNERAFIWRGTAEFYDIKNLLDRFVGPNRANKAIMGFKKKYNIQESEPEADAKFINFSEKLLTGTIGSASSKILLSSVIEEHPISLNELLRVLEESKETAVINKKLQHQSSQLTRLTNQLQEVNKELIRQDQMKDSFLDTVAHELKTPITSIRASSELLLDDEMPKELKLVFLENIQKDTERLTVLINNILNYEKLSTGREQLQLAWNDLKVVIETAMNRIYPIAESESIKIHSFTYGNLTTEFDFDKILQVLTNLLANSLKYTEPNKGIIVLTANEQDNHLEVSVEDNGKGIDADDIPYIFNKFYQSKNQHLRKPSGSGFGLAICKQIVELHNGKIWVDETYEEGAKFVFTIPK